LTIMEFDDIACFMVLKPDQPCISFNNTNKSITSNFSILSWRNWRVRIDDIVADANLDDGSKLYTSRLTHVPVFGG
jgi:hypothetical protein